MESHTFPMSSQEEQLFICRSALQLLEGLKYVPDVCTLCSSEGRSDLHTLCGDPRHGICSHCLARMCDISARQTGDADEQDNDLVQHVWYSPEFSWPARVKCPQCRQSREFSCWDINGEPPTPYVSLPALPGRFVLSYQVARRIALETWANPCPGPTVDRPLPSWLRLPVTIVSVLEDLTRFGTFQCPFSPTAGEEVFSTAEAFHRHSSQCNRRPINCSHCQASVQTRVGLKEHVISTCPSVKCNLCDVSGPWSKIEVHVKQHNSLTPLQSGGRQELQHFSWEDWKATLKRLTEPEHMNQLLMDSPNREIQGLTELHLRLKNLIPEAKRPSRSQSPVSTASSL